ncbi:MAG TPA: peptidoglycan-binding protein [Ilumatobacteraceae bacterium]|nr:peptidoglycan-binding protein [Ilumatobacteraceae bacterium]
MRSRPFLAVVAAIGSVVGATLIGAVSTPASTVDAAGTTSAYVALPTSQRLIDTRLSGPIRAGGTISAAVTGAAPLPAAGTVSAAVLNVTVAPPAAPGYWTVWPHTNARPVASNVNIDELQSLSGNVTPNLVTVPVGADGIIDLYTSGGGNVIVDLLGYYTPAASASAGRFQPLAAPTRVLDTRGFGAFRPGETRTFTVPRAAGSSAVAINLTSVTVARGYWQVFANGSPRPATSNLNSPPGLFAVVANQAIVTLDATGSISIFSQSGGDLIIDVVGTYSGAGAADSTSGLFVPMATPTRIVDTRDPALNPLGGTTRPAPGWRFEVPVSSHRAINRSDVSAVVVNATTADPLAVGFVTVGTAGATDPRVWPTTSTMNVVRPDQTLANHAIVPVSVRGFSMFTQPGGHLIADIAGYFLGSPAPAPFAAPTNSGPARCATQTVGAPGAPVGPIVYGSSRVAVANLQTRLLQLGFWNAGADGVYGLSTTQAVMAFQKWKGLPATTAVDNRTAIALNTEMCRPAAGRSGDLFEVDKTKQIAFVVRGGAVQYVFNVSTGNGKSYDEEDQKAAGRRVIGIALTPSGTFRTYREHDVVRYEGDLGSLYRPKFVVGGIAVHGAPRVPNYPASHGCVRVANPVMDLIWSRNLLPLRSTVWIHD